MSGVDHVEPEAAGGAATGTSEPTPTRTSHLPGTGAMWFFVLGDMVIFGLYFIAYLAFRARDVHMYRESQLHLDQNIGFVNTLVLLISSWLMAQAVLAARSGDLGPSLRRIYGAAGCGILFILLKLGEWWSEIQAGYTVKTDDFFGFYYMLTGVHLLHVVIGLITLGAVAFRLRTRSRSSAKVVEQGATYWHMVDFLWVLIFAMVYLVR
ncbi:cytochrome c oxidase subunit 3 [Gordonia rhizosphera]|uniref:Cytochrome aa3 subunit 3 n=1 Tax=Gordonia rhizosphera NBRC 16068 TaxID=1108045 RepID=K6WC04_9ACTN|nr:cytochrome c oxidase subunit 3 [Gordonia rhizosphera]GAB89722.1 cytochrome c oxidase subunit III [Gordonia rhizosphera NBRC 16068]